MEVTRIDSVLVLALVSNIRPACASEVPGLVQQDDHLVHLHKHLLQNNPMSGYTEPCRSNLLVYETALDVNMHWALLSEYAS